MKKTKIVINKKAKTVHDYHIRGEVSEDILDTIAEKIERAEHPDDVLEIMNKLGLDVMHYDSEGCYVESEFEYNSEFVEELE